MASPARAIRASARGYGERKQRRAATRASEILRDRSGEDVFFLPGKIPISLLRQYQALARAKDGPELLTRFMVRGHWRRPPAGWKDLRLRWIEPYWKGPDMAPVVEREYRMKL